MPTTTTIKTNTTHCTECHEVIRVSGAAQKELATGDWEGAMCKECWEHAVNDGLALCGISHVNMIYGYKDGVLCSPVGRIKKTLDKYKGAANPDTIQSRVMAHDLKRVLGTAGLGYKFF